MLSPGPSSVPLAPGVTASSRWVPRRWTRGSGIASLDILCRALVLLGLCVPLLVLALQECVEEGVQGHELRRWELLEDPRLFGGWVVLFSTFLVLLAAVSFSWALMARLGCLVQEFRMEDDARNGSIQIGKRAPPFSRSRPASAAASLMGERDAVRTEPGVCFGAFVICKFGGMLLSFALSLFGLLFLVPESTPHSCSQRVVIFSETLAGMYLGTFLLLLASAACLFNRFCACCAPSELGVAVLEAVADLPFRLPATSQHLVMLEDGRGGRGGGSGDSEGMMGGTDSVGFSSSGGVEGVPDASSEGDGFGTHSDADDDAIRRHRGNSTTSSNSGHFRPYIPGAIPELYDPAVDPTAQRFAATPPPRGRHDALSARSTGLSMTNLSPQRPGMPSHAVPEE